MNRVVPLVLALASLSGCAESTSIYHHRSLNGATPTAITVDSDQRHVFLVPPGGEKQGADTSERAWRLCAESAPDTFSANSASGSGSLGVSGLGSAGSPSGEGKFGLSVSEIAATVERTQTVNLLRESMYRTCERFLSGAIDKSTFVVQAARDQRTMLAVLAIEQLTRTVRPPSTVITAPATSSSITDNREMTALLTQHNDERLAADTAAKSAAASYQAALGTGKCDTVTAPPGADATDPSLPQWTECSNAKAKAHATGVAAKAATKRYEDALALAKAASPSVIEVSTQTHTPSTGQGSAALDSAALQKVAEVVRDIATSRMIDETLMFCIAYLTDKGNQNAAAFSPAALDLRKTCTQILLERGRSDNAERASAFGEKPATVVEFSTQPQVARLRAYLQGGANEAERKRRGALIGQAMRDMGLPGEPIDVATFAVSGDPMLAAEVIGRLQALEVVAAAKAELNQR